MKSPAAHHSGKCRYRGCNSSRGRRSSAAGGLPRVRPIAGRRSPVCGVTTGGCHRVAPVKRTRDRSAPSGKGSFEGAAHRAPTEGNRPPSGKGSFEGGPYRATLLLRRKAGAEVLGGTRGGPNSNSLIFLANQLPTLQEISQVTDRPARFRPNRARRVVLL